MTVKKEITVTLTERDKEVLLTMHAWVRDLDCDGMLCNCCPFQSFCDTCHPATSEPDEALENIKEAIIDALDN